MKRRLTFVYAIALICTALLASITVFAADTNSEPFAADPGSDPNEINAIEAAVSAFAYPDLFIRVGEPACINFTVEEEMLNFCNNKILIPAFGISQALEPGDNVITFMPTETGEYIYTCWMGMIRGTITVVDQDSQLAGSVQPSAAGGMLACPMFGVGGSQEDSAYQGGGFRSCCGS